MRKITIISRMRSLGGQPRGLRPRCRGERGVFRSMPKHDGSPPRVSEVTNPALRPNVANFFVPGRLVTVAPHRRCVEVRGFLWREFDYGLVVSRQFNRRARSSSRDSETGFSTGVGVTDSAACRACAPRRGRVPRWLRGRRIEASTPTTRELGRIAPRCVPDHRDVGRRDRHENPRPTRV
jgi:hypothetical protein